MASEETKDKKPKIYTAESKQYIQEMEINRRQNAEKTEKEKRTVSHRQTENEKVRRRVRETEQKLQVLFVILGVLIVLLIIALIYEIGFGNGLIQTGGERMSESAGLALQSLFGGVL